MQPRELSAAELLEVWEQGSGRGGVERAVALLAALHSTAYPHVLRWPVGLRDAHLLAFRMRAFGALLEFLADCPRCGEIVEAELPIEQILEGAHDVAEQHDTVLAGGAAVTFRPVTSEDVLLALADGGTATLLERCVIHAEPALAAGAEPHIAAALAAADPLADLQIQLTCPSCDTAWSATFDPPGFVWRELDAWARRTLGEVHALAAAYGWSERDILALAPVRRAAYLEMLA